MDRQKELLARLKELDQDIPVALLGRLHFTPELIAQLPPPVKEQLTYSPVLTLTLVEDVKDI